MSYAYSWQKPYQDAVVETNFQKLPERIAKVEQAIHRRLAESPPPFIDSAEFQAIGTTFATLAALKAQITGNHVNLRQDWEEVGGYCA
jgi:hypothetical protein